MCREQSSKEVRRSCVFVVVIHLYAVAEIAEVSLSNCLFAELSVCAHSAAAAQEMTFKFDLVCQRIRDRYSVGAVVKLLRK